jgi:hypothetical protein
LKGFIKNIQVDFISLVKKGANQKEIIYKSDSAFTCTVPIRKIDDEKRMVYGVVYSPDETDTQGQYSNTEEIEKAAERFMKSGKTAMVDKNHDEKAEQGFVKESWIKKDIDPLFPAEKNGAWIVGIKIENEKTWEEIQKGEIAGLSMQGTAVVEQDARETFQGEETLRGDLEVFRGLFEKLKKYAASITKACFTKGNSVTDENAICGEPAGINKDIDCASDSALNCKTEKFDVILKKLDEMKELLSQKDEIIEKSACKSRQILEQETPRGERGWKWL